MILNPAYFSSGYHGIDSTAVARSAHVLSDDLSPCDTESDREQTTQFDER